MSEEEIIKILSDEIVALNVGHEKYDEAVKGLTDLYYKEKEEKEKFKKEIFELNKEMSDFVDQWLHKDKIREKIIEDTAKMNTSVNTRLKKIYQTRIEFGEELLGGIK